MSSNHLTCVLCLDKYNTKELLPKSLPCLHTFCRQCLVLFLQKTHASNQLKCPSCRKCFQRPEYGVDDLPTNFMLRDLLETSQPANLMCTSHVDKAACVVCLDCQVGLCTVCITKLASSPHVHHNLADVESLAERARELCEDMEHLKANIDSVHHEKLKQLTECATSASESINRIATETTRKITDWKRMCLKQVQNVEMKVTENISATYDDLSGKVLSSDTIMVGGLPKMNELKQHKQELCELTDKFENLSFDIDMRANLKLVTEGNVHLLWSEQTVTQATINEAEKKLEAQQWKEKAETHLHIQVNVVLEDCFKGHQGYDLFDKSKASFRMFQVQKTAKLTEFMKMLSENLNFNIDQFRPWPFVLRADQSFRPTLIDIEVNASKTMQELQLELQEMHLEFIGQCPWTVFVETINPGNPFQTLPSFDKDADVLLFFKCYDPRSERILYCGHHYMPVTNKLSDIKPMLCQRGGFPADTPLILFDEVRPDLVEEIKDHDLPLHNVVKELLDGNIIIFQKLKDLSDMEVVYNFPTAIHYFRNFSDNL